MTLRRLLWANHGHTEYLYGDDGEMQCKFCVLDFKRASVELIEKVINENGMFEAAKFVTHQCGLPWTDPRSGKIYHPPKVEQL